MKNEDKFKHISFYLKRREKRKAKTKTEKYGRKKDNGDWGGKYGKQRRN